jgi:indolepyruvate ferredoxin oxidoreductase beta subunit
VKKLEILVTGVGGQGIILASDILSEAALAAGYDVKKTDTIGMAQRGGAVLSNVRIAAKVYSPLIKEGEVDLLLAFEKLEAARWGNYLRPGAIAIVNQYAQPPLAVNVGNESYPSDEEITSILRQRAERIYYVDGTARAREIGDVRTVNIFMLGCASVFLPFKVPTWQETISQHVPARAKEMNMVAFAAGRKEIRNANLG